jgi:hypothetical protein
MPTSLARLSTHTPKNTTTLFFFPTPTTTPSQGTLLNRINTGSPQTAHHTRARLAQLSQSRSKVSSHNTSHKHETATPTTKNAGTRYRFRLAVEGAFQSWDSDE